MECKHGRLRQGGAGVKIPSLLRRPGALGIETWNRGRISGIVPVVQASGGSLGKRHVTGPNPAERPERWPGPNQPLTSDKIETLLFFHYCRDHKALSGAYGVVKNHGGHLTVSSEKGRGTTFSIYLPASTKKVKDMKRVSKAPVRGHGRVMVVDDEDMIRDLAKEVLEASGYDVVVAADGKEAVDIYSKEWRRIDAVILDLIMPGMSGGETYDFLKEINPDVRAILLSGYSLEGDATGIMEKGCNDFIQEPFSIEELSYKLKNLLEGGQGEDRFTS